MSKASLVFIAVLFLLLESCGPDNKELMTLSRDLMNQGDFAAALPLLDRIIKRDSKNQLAYNMRGITKLELGQADNAIHDFDVCIVLDGNDYRSFYNRGNAYYQIERFSLAIRDYDEALRLQPKEVDIYINRGNALVQMEKYSEAIFDYDFAVRLNAGNYLTHFNLARTYYLMDSLDLAKRSFENCVDVYPAYAPGYYFLGMIALEKDELEASCILFQKASDLGYEQAKEVRKLYCE